MNEAGIKQDLSSSQGLWNQKLDLIIYPPLVSFLKGGLFMFHGFFQILGVTIKFIRKDAEEKKASFNPRPFFRLFINWLHDLGSLEPVTGGVNIQVFIIFSNADFYITWQNLPINRDVICLIYHMTQNLYILENYSLVHSLIFSLMGVISFENDK